MKRRIVYLVITCMVFMCWQPIAVKADLFKGGAKEKKELSADPGTSSLLDMNGGEDGGGLLYPDDETLPDGDPIGLPVDASAEVAIFMIVMFVFYLGVRSKNVYRSPSGR